MKVGLFINTQFPEGFAVADRVPEMVEQVRAACDAGFASLWLPHHWLTHPLQMLQITPIMSYLSAHAQGMTIGPNILILPPLNPVHVAEEAATLDVLTGGNYNSWQHPPPITGQRSHQEFNFRSSCRDLRRLRAIFFN
jgi:hypothetical protein